MSESVPGGPGFSDATVVAYDREAGRCRVRILSWAETTVVVEFVEILGLADYGASEIADLRHAAELSDFARRTLAQHYEEVPEDHPFRAFAFVDPDDRVVMEIVARGVTVTELR